MARTVKLELTPAQARTVNAALALYEAEDHEYDDEFRPAVVERTRTKVWTALTDAGVEP